MVEEGRYLYCIIEAEGSKAFGPHGIAEHPEDLPQLPELYTVNDQHLAVVVSQSPVIEYPVTREYSMIHQRAIETAMKEHDVLPVRFCTIARTEQQIVTQVLRPRHGEFMQELAKIKGKQEISVKAYWLDMKQIFQEIFEQTEELKRLKSAISGVRPEAAHYDLIEGGRTVQRRLQDTREADQQTLLKALEPLAVESRTNRVYGETMVANIAFLIENDKEEAFHQAVSKLQEDIAGRMNLKYITGAPPFNFVTIVIHFDDPDKAKAAEGTPQGRQRPEEARRDVPT